MMPKITVEQVLKRKAVVVKPEDTVDKVAKILAKNKVSSAVIVENDEIIGIVTDRDILDKIVAKGKNPKHIKVREIMTKNPVRIEYDYDIQDAIELMMDKGVRRILVTKLGKPIGFVTAADLLAALAMYNSEEQEVESVESETEVYGICEVCGQYGPLYRVYIGGQEKWVCESCKDSIEQ
ncbi:CBS domain-containing protein [Thermococcus barophilus]|uniref:Inosine-5'-monophosphate dehydrogenase n=2 Tax=Thermococcus barophilus TaxID=55802 RepID=A0A0S1XBK8_THEBA|nr:CBS domain-containing protein [Thermococcus barophilus]ADT83975.1 inosine-5'-monophosphate dehydrogenase like protein [Thermococcus barophilus MP]ALM75120.1 Inosine-5'-monophosphate dehydrogenase [Thermococcus barophilus]